MTPRQRQQAARNARRRDKRPYTPGVWRSRFEYTPSTLKPEHAVQWFGRETCPEPIKYHRPTGDMRGIPVYVIDDPGCTSTESPTTRAAWVEAYRRWLTTVPAARVALPPLDTTSTLAELVDVVATAPGVTSPTACPCRACAFEGRARCLIDTTPTLAEFVHAGREAQSAAWREQLTGAR
jgi:hypothetical protein